MASSCGRGYCLSLNFDAPLLQFYESAADVCSRLLSVSAGMAFRERPRSAGRDEKLYLQAKRHVGLLRHRL